MSNCCVYHRCGAGSFLAERHMARERLSHVVEVTCEVLVASCSVMKLLQKLVKS